MGTVYNLSPGSDAGRTGTDTMTKACTTGTAIKTYCLTVLQQPTENIPDIITSTAPDFRRHLVTAQQNANHFVNDIHPMMAQNVAHIISFSNLWKNFGPHFIELGNQGNWTAVEQGLRIVQQHLATYSSACDSTATALGNFNKLIEVDSGAFSLDYNLLTNAQTGIPAEIDDQHKIIAHETEVMQTANTLTTTGAALGTVGIVLTVAGAFFGPLAVAGILLDLASLGCLIAGAVMADQASKAINDAQTKLGQYLKEMADLKAYDTTVSQLKKSVSKAVDDIGKLRSTWDMLHDDLDTVVNDVKEARSLEDTPWFDETITTAVDDWTQVNSMAETAQLQVANSSFQTVDLSTGSNSLINALPAEEQQKIREAGANRAA